MSNRAEIRTDVLETERLRIGYRVAGNPEDLPVLLLHGSFATSRWWEPFLQVLADGFYFVAPDLRGCGATALPDEDYAIETQAEDVHALVEALGWDEFELVGHSSGGAIAIEYTLAYPEHVRTLTLVDSAPIEGIYTPVDMFVVLEEMRTDQDLLRRALAALMPTYAGASGDSDTDSDRDRAAQAFFAQLVEDAARMAPTAYTGIAEALARWNRFADANQLTHPTLLVWGELDEVVDRDATTRMLISIPGAANLEVLRNVGHSPMIEAPVGLAERFVEFVTDDLDDYDEIRQQALDDAGKSGDAKNGEDASHQP